MKGVDLVRDLAEEYNRDPEKFMSGAVDDRADVNGKEQKQLISINGVEFSCEDEKGRYHILGYGFDPAAEAINKAADHTHELRMEKFHSRLDFLKEEFGFVFKEEDIKALEAQGNPARPHVGNLMVKYGYAESKDDAIRNYINKKHFASLHIKPQEAIDAIIESGGIPVLAHPNFGDGSQYISGREVEERIAYLLDMGIRGIEVYYSRTSQEDMEQLLMLAEKHRLIVTCGSDYHGSNKTVRIGQTNVPNVSG